MDSWPSRKDQYYTLTWALLSECSVNYLNGFFWWISKLKANFNADLQIYLFGHCECDSQTKHKLNGFSLLIEWSDWAWMFLCAWYGVLRSIGWVVLWRLHDVLWSIQNGWILSGIVSYDSIKFKNSQFMLRGHFKILSIFNMNRSLTKFVLSVESIAKENKNINILAISTDFIINVSLSKVPV